MTAGFTAVLIYYITVDRGLGEEVVGLVLSAWALGSLLGSLVAARLAPKAVGAVMLGGAATFGTAILFAVGTPVPVMVAAAFIAGLVNANVLVAYISLRTLLSPDAHAGPGWGDGPDALGRADADRDSLAAGLALDAVGGSARRWSRPASLVILAARPVRAPSRRPAGAARGVTRRASRSGTLRAT